MFLSVSVPVYNAEKYLDACISSVMNQTMKSFELILVNDGSKDSSLRICESWKSRFPDQIRVIDNPNQGSLLTRRTCIAESKGDYLYIMDSDDYLTTDTAFEKISEAVSRYSPDMLFFDYKRGLPDKALSVTYPFQNEEIFQGTDREKIYKLLIETKRMNSLWNKVFSRDIVDFSADYSEYKEVSVGTDFFQVLPVISAAKKLLYLKEELYFYRETQGSIVHKFNPRHAASLEINQKWLEKNAGSWDWKADNLDELLANRYMISVSTIVNKARLIEKKSGVSRYDYIKSIGDGELFRQRYLQANLQRLSFFRRTIVRLLYKRQYGLLASIYSIL